MCSHMYKGRIVCLLWFQTCREAETSTNCNWRFWGILLILECNSRKFWAERMILGKKKKSKSGASTLISNNKDNNTSRNNNNNNICFNLVFQVGVKRLQPRFKPTCGLSLQFSKRGALHLWTCHLQCMAKHNTRSGKPQYLSGSLFHTTLQWF